MEPRPPDSALALPARDPTETVDAVIERALRARLEAGTGHVPRERLRRLFSMLGAGGPIDQLDDDTVAVLSLMGVDTVADEDLSLALAQARAVGIDAEHVVPISQAYARGVVRMVEAEATAIRALLRRVPAEERALCLERVLAHLLPLAERGFNVLHTSALHEALSADLAAGQIAGAPDAPVCVALVDLSGSTRYLATADRLAAQDLVDGLFAAGQVSTATRPVQVLKHVGDGIFFVGRSPEEVLSTCIDALEHIEITLPLPARAGVAFGPVLRRAGDYFGLPVNLAQLLTKVAKPGTVLATQEAAAVLPPALRGRRRRVRIRGWDETLELVSVRRPSPSA